MKTKFFSKKIVTLFLVAICFICLGVEISIKLKNDVLAEEKDVKVEIVACNLSFQDSIKLMYAVKTENIAEANLNKVEVLVWKNGKKEYRKPTNNYSLSLYRIEEIQGEKYAIFLNDQIKAKEVGDNLYAVPYYSNGQSEVYGEVVKYSALDYAFDMRGSKESNADLDKVITSMLNYSSAAQEMLDYKEDRLVNSKFYQIKIHGGVLEDESARGLFKKGEQIQITSTTENFVCWLDSRDNIISYDFTFTYTVTRNDVIKASTVQIEPDYDSNGLEYEKINENEYRLIGLGTCTAKNIVVPKYYNEKPVTQIDNAVFRNNTEIKSVTFDGGFDNFTQSMFNGCSSLERLVISGMYDKDLYWLFGESINDIPETFVELEFAKNSNYMDYSMFKGSSSKKLCNHIITLVLPEGITEIRDSEFENCVALQAVKIPEGVTKIGYYAFNNTGLASIDIPDSVTTINSAAFERTNLTSVDIPNGVTTIGDYAFGFCKNLKDVYIGASVNIISCKAFGGCDELVNVEIDKDNVRYHAAGNCIIKTATKTLIHGFNSSIIPADGSVEIIGTGAFENCGKMESIIIPEGVKSIGMSAFVGCYKLTEVQLPNSLIEIGSGAFANINKDILFEKYQGVYYLGNWAIEAVNNTITKVEFKEGTVGFADGAIGGCDLLAEVSLKGIKYIGKHAFSGCSSLTSIEIPNSVTEIGNEAFRNCSKLQSVTIGSGVTSIGDYAFYNCSSLTSVEIPNSVTSIGNDAFYNCSKLTSITIPNSVTSIGDYAFYNCSSLTKVIYTGTIDDWVQISFDMYYANPLYYANNLYIDDKPVTEANITKATKINNYAFYNCSSLTSVTIGNSVTSIGRYAFYNCSSLTSVTFSDATTWYRTTNSTNWQDKTDGTQIDVTTPSTNATYFKSTYVGYYWYKL